MMLKIGWRWFSVRYDGPIFDKDGDECVAYCSKPKEEIVINNMLPERVQEEALLSQIIDQIDDNMCLNLSEDQTYALSNGLKMFFDDNWRDIHNICKVKEEAFNKIGEEIESERESSKDS